MQTTKSIEEAEQFMLRHGENIVDTLGAEVDRIEKNLRVSYFVIFVNSTCLYYSWNYLLIYQNLIHCILEL